MLAAGHQLWMSPDAVKFARSPEAVQWLRLLRTHANQASPRSLSRDEARGLSVFFSLASETAGVSGRGGECICQSMKGGVKQVIKLWLMQSQRAGFRFVAVFLSGNEHRCRVSSRLRLQAIPRRTARIHQNCDNWP